jgi:hypothetical protein
LTATAVLGVLGALTALKATPTIYLGAIGRPAISDEHPGMERGAQRPQGNSERLRGFEAN